MKVLLDVAVSERRGGVRATAASVDLVSHGLDSEDAVAALRKTIHAWLASLTRVGQIEEVLSRRGVEWTPGEGRAEVELRMVDGVPS